MVSFTSDHSPAGHSHLFCTLVCYFCLSFEVVAHHNTVIILHLGLTGCYTYFIHLHVKSICVALCQQSQERSNIEKVKISVTSESRKSFICIFFISKIGWILKCKLAKL